MSLETKTEGDDHCTRNDEAEQARTGGSRADAVEMRKGHGLASQDEATRGTA